MTSVVSRSELLVCKAIFRYHLQFESGITIEQLQLPLDQNYVDQLINKMVSDELVSLTASRYSLTVSGRAALKVVMTGGAYDLLHIGHLETLEEAQTHGNFLVAVIARDVTIKKRKRNPIQNELQRLRLLNQLSVVDLALLGDTVDHFKIIEFIRPDIITLGANQFHNESSLKRQLIERGVSSTLVRLEAKVESQSTTQLLKRIIANHENSD